MLKEIIYVSLVYNCNEAVILNQLTMITREEYDEAERIVLAYQKQILTVIGSVQYEHKKSKRQDDVKEGDLVECVFVHSASTKHLTKGKNYPVLRTEQFYSDGGRFEIETDSGKKKWYYTTNKHFKVI